MSAASPRIGISAIGVFQPSQRLGNDWFGDRLARKFVHHTGTTSRGISAADEVGMGQQAVDGLQREVNCDLRDCAAVVFVSPSFVPPATARRFLPRELWAQERLDLAAKQLVRRLNIPRCPRFGINWFCSGYSKAMTLVRRCILPAIGLGRNQFVLVVTAGRISRITDYACTQTGPLFGDMATASLISRTDSPQHPVHFELLYASAEKCPAPGVFFDFDLRQNVLSPAVGGGEDHRATRLVFSLDGMGIADIAPRAMSDAVAQALQCRGIAGEAVRFVVPHQAGAGIVRLTGMKLEQLGLRAELINGITGDVGNVSSSSIPYALKQTWHKLDGIIACPTAAVGAPGKAEVSQGCILLRARPDAAKQRAAA